MLPKIFSIGSFYLPTYGVLVALGFLLALAVTTRLAKRSGMNVEAVTNLAVYCALAGLIGAKLLMIIFDWNDPQIKIFSLATLQAAGVFQGGLILAIITAFLYVRKQKLPWLQTADVFAPGLALGHAIGRLGCFAAGCCWGTECTRPWAVTFTNPDAAALTGVPLNKPLHPAQLYEVFALLALFAFLYWRIGKPHPPGRVLGLYLVISSVARFAIEFTRNHEQALPFGLPFSITQWIAIALALFGVVILVRSASGSAKVSTPAAA